MQAHPPRRHPAVTVCSCEQWTDQAYNIKTRTDQIPGNEWLGYDATNPPADDHGARRTTPARSPTTARQALDLPRTATSTAPDFNDRRRAHAAHTARGRSTTPPAGTTRPAPSWAAALQAESEPTDLTKIRGNYTHDDTTIRGGKAQTQEYADTYGYKMVVTMSMANDYNGYIATYRDYMGRDHYRKALTGWGPHSSDFFATRLTPHRPRAQGRQRSPARDRRRDRSGRRRAGRPGLRAGRRRASSPIRRPRRPRSRAIGEAAAAGVAAYDGTMPDDGAGAPTPTTSSPRTSSASTPRRSPGSAATTTTTTPTCPCSARSATTGRRSATRRARSRPSLQYPATDPERASSPTARAARSGSGRRPSRRSSRASRPRGRPAGPRLLGDAGGHLPLRRQGRAARGRRRRALHGRLGLVHVAPWSGMTVDHAGIGSDRHVSFDAGPTHHVDERRIRGTSTRRLRQARLRHRPGRLPRPRGQRAGGDGLPRSSTRPAATAPTARPTPSTTAWTAASTTGSTRTSDLVATVTFHAPGGHDVVETDATRTGTSRRTARWATARPPTSS